MEWRARGLAPLVTFVVPTVGRESLGKAVRSLREQSLDWWEAVIIGDNTFIPQTFDGEVDDRIRTHSVFGVDGRLHTAGVCRNIGMGAVNPECEWLAFLDDDDTLNPEYVQELNDVAAFSPETDAVVFRMDHPKLGILPDPVLPKIAHGQVGISFAVKQWIVREHQLQFIPENNLETGGVGRNEDITFLLAVVEALREHEYVYPDTERTKPPALPMNLMIHSQVMYHVGGPQ